MNFRQRLANPIAAPALETLLGLSKLPSTFVPARLPGEFVDVSRGSPKIPAPKTNDAPRTYVAAALPTVKLPIRIAVPTPGKRRSGGGELTLDASRPYGHQRG